MKTNLNRRITIWFVVVLLISLFLYGALIFGVYRFTLRGENYIRSMEDSLNKNEIVNQRFIDRFREWEKSKPPPLFPEATIITPGIFFRIGAIITGGVLVIIIISIAGGFLFLRRSLKQIDTITKNVKEIDEKQLHLRIGMKGKDPISKMANTFDKMLDKIEESFKSQKQFIQNASHELNTPLTVIKTRIDALKQKKDISKMEYLKTLDMIDEEIMRLSRMTEELLVLSELEENSKKDFTSVDLDRILNRILDIFENKLDSRDITAIKKVKGNSKIFGSEVKLSQLFFNLLDNAAKYGKPGKEVVINLVGDEVKKEIEIKISNITEHIDEKKLDTLFERFYKDNKGKDKKGFGLGLSIVKKIVEIHNGSISVDYSDETEKIVFSIIFPEAKNIQAT